MHWSLTFFSLLPLMISRSECAMEAVDIYRSIRDDLAKFNITCYKDKCEQDQGGSRTYGPCLCGIECVHLGACCADSIYASVVQPNLKPACRSINKNEVYGYYMVDQCTFDSVWINLCNDEWNGEDDVQKIVPVTSLLTSITYKNYYCFRCHETNDEFLYWNVWLEGNFTHHERPSGQSEQPYSDISLTYHKDMGTWMATYDGHVGYFPVTVHYRVPQNIYMLVRDCETNVISDCSDDWFDEEVRSKCQSYMSLKEVTKMGTFIKYKNIHCALCNFQNLNDIKCRTGAVGGFGFGATPFSFTHLLDINPKDGDIVGKIQKCSEDSIWDPFTKKCRELTCALPGFEVKNGKCVQVR